MRSVRFAVTLAAIAAQALARDDTAAGTSTTTNTGGKTGGSSTGGTSGSSSGSSSSVLESEQEICQHAINELRNQSADINEVL